MRTLPMVVSTGILAFLSPALAVQFITVLGALPGLSLIPPFRKLGDWVQRVVCPAPASGVSFRVSLLQVTLGGITVAAVGVVVGHA